MVVQTLIELFRVSTSRGNGQPQWRSGGFLLCQLLLQYCQALRDSPGRGPRLRVSMPHVLNNLSRLRCGASQFGGEKKDDRGNIQESQGATRTVNGTAK